MNWQRAFAFCFALVAALRADVNVPIATEPGSNITIKVSSPVTSVPHFGYMPLRVAIENITARDGTWRFGFEAGSRAVFPGITTSGLTLDVAAGQSREAWVFVPLAVPAITINPVALNPTTTFGSVPLPSSPPPIPGVYPNPQLPGVSYDIGRPVTSSNAQGLTRVFTIRQTGPASLLPPVPSRDLPRNASVTTSPPDASGNVTRTTVVTVEVPRGAGTTAPTTASPGSIAMNNARQQLAQAGLMPPRADTRLSARTGPGRTAGTNEVSVTVVQTGAAADLPLPPLASLPKGFTSVDVSPDPAGSGVVREFTYVEEVPVPAVTKVGVVGVSGAAAPGTGGFPVGRSGLLSSNASTVEAEARKVLEPAGLLRPAAGVRTVASSQFVTVPGVSGAGPYRLVTFEQTGPISSLPQPVPAALPAGVKAVVFPTPGSTNATRVITVIEPAVVSAYYAAVAGGVGTTSSSMSQGTGLARLELQRLGLLRPQAGVSSGTSFRNSPGTSGHAPDVIIVTESGPPPQLPPIPAAILPAGITCSNTPGPLAGEVSRNFVVQIPALIAGAGGTAPVRVSSPPPVRYSSGAPTLPGSLVIDVEGPGVAPGMRASFPNAIGNTAMAPMAATPLLEATLRHKLAGAGIGALPNLSGFDPRQAPADWRLWSSFNSVVLGHADYLALDPARRAALRSWVALGGVLFLSPPATTTASTERLGSGRIETLNEPAADIAPPDLIERIRIKVTSPGMPERERAKLQPGTPMGDLVRFEPPQVVWLSVMLVAFALVIGPVNLFWLAPAARRHRLFVTTPLISLGGAAAVLGAILLQDGVGGDGIRRALVVFVPGDNQAAVFQEQSVRTGFLFRREFPLDDAVLAAVLPTEEATSGPGLHAGTFKRDSGHAGGDWFRNRSRQAHMLRTLVPTRARIEVVGSTGTGAPIVESTVATELREFRLRDDRGMIWGATALPTGRRTVLQLQARFEAAARASQTYGGNGTANFGGLVTDAMTLDEPWRWSARGGGTELAPIATLGSIRWRDDDVLFAGVAPVPARGRSAATTSEPGTAP